MSKYFTLGWQKSIIPLTSTLRDALTAISNCGAMMACVADEDGKLLGILTDSDIRRALLKGAALETAISDFINNSPVLGDYSMSPEALTEVAEKFGVREMPLIDERRVLRDIFAIGTHDTRLDGANEATVFTETNARTAPPRENPMMILAGGLGTRLRPMVSDKPKPLAVVGERPILETLILRAAAQGIRKFYVSVNYLAEQIESHLSGDVYNGLTIKVIREPERLGTAGSLSLIPDPISCPIVVANADILTTASYEELFYQHEKLNSYITCSVRPYKHRVPFGVFNIDDAKIVGLQEKPETIFTVNAGMYALSPEAVKDVPAKKYFDMTDLIAHGLKYSKTISPFMLHEYWIDIGKPDDFLQANAEYHLHFR